MEATITGYKKGSVLFFKRGEKKIAFDLKDLEFKRILKSGALKTLITSGAFFRKLTPHDVADGFKDEAYKELIKKVANNESSRMTNFASVFANVSQYIHLESYLLLGIDVGTHAFSNSASQFTKEVLEFMKESGIRFTNDGFEKNFNLDKKLVTDLCTYVRRRHYLDLEVYRMLYSIVADRYNFQILQSLVIPLGEVRSLKTTYYGNETVIGYGCEYKSLFDYLVRIDRTEAVEFKTALVFYRDYLSMSRKMERSKQLLKLQETKPEATLDEIGYDNLGRIEKYPAYLRTRHDIVSKNYSAYKNKYDEIKFRKNVEYGFEYAWGNYKMVAPKSSDDIKNEGGTLHHCVASYVDRVLDGTTQILFMRKDENESLVTVEVRNNAVVQARGYNNRSIDALEKRWLETFARNKNLNYGSVKRNDKMPTPPVVALVKYDKDVAFLREVSQLVNG